MVPGLNYFWIYELTRKVDFDLTRLVFKKDLKYNEWESLGQVLKKAEKSVQWWLGDWLNYGEAKYGEKYSQVLEIYRDYILDKPAIFTLKSFQIHLLLFLTCHTPFLSHLYIHI